jgi:nucleoside-diphosphate-sugar epimerase
VLVHHVVLGGAGFIGSHLVDQLLLDDQKVLVLDDFSTGRIENLPIGQEGLHVEYADLLGDSTWTAKAVKHFEGKIDRVWCLASPASPLAYQAARIKTLRLGTGMVDLALSLANLCQARFLFASSSEVYGDPRRHPQPEWYRGNVSSVGPRSCYDEAKRAGEAFCAAYAEELGVEVRIARIFNTYGPRMRADDGRVVTNFLSAALEDKPMTVYGSGTQTRSFCYVGDTVAGICTVMEKGDSQPYNVGNPAEEMPIISLVQTIKSIFTDQPDPIFVEDPIGDDPSRRCPDVSRLLDLGWEPQTKLQEGLTLMALALRDELQRKAVS